MNFKINESVTKLRGGYYTPAPIALFLSKWILNIKPREVLEPSCGDGAFIRAFLGLHRHKINFTGLELLEEEADKARQVAKSDKLLNTKVINTDFLEWSLEQLSIGKQFNAAVGNPPYIRYQYLEAKDQHFSEQIFKRFNLPFTKHTNAWVPFVIACVALLAPAGRFAMVIPSELLHVLHATSLRSFLLEECSRIVIMDPNELLFDEALQGTVLLMLEKKGDRKKASNGVSIISAPNNDFLLEDPKAIFEKAVFTSGDILNGKWMKVLLEPAEIDVFEEVAKSSKIKKFVDIASVDVGIVTGANKFFLVDNATISQYKLEKYARPMFGRSEHCPGIIYDEKAHKKNQTRGLPTNFLMFGNVPFEKLPKRVQEYILMGEEQELQTRYKCRIRKPWYCVPSIYTTPVGMLKRCHNFPRLILNTADAYTTDTAYRIKPAEGINPTNLVYNFINSLTALTAELEGRHYGGGVLELVPSEIEKLLIPAPSKKAVDIGSLNEKISAGCDADSLLLGQDKIVLKNAGVSKSDQLVIHEAWQRIRTRRHRLIGE